MENNNQEPEIFGLKLENCKALVTVDNPGLPPGVKDIYYVEILKIHISKESLVQLLNELKKLI